MVTKSETISIHGEGLSIMTTSHRLTPDTVLPVGVALPGDTIELVSSDHAPHDPNHVVPRILSGLRGTRARPIIITLGGDGTAIITSGRGSAEEARRFVNQTMETRMAGGYFPGPGLYGDLAMLTLRNCQHIIIRDLTFDQCWLTALYLDDCQYIAVQGCNFTGGTIAIGANGLNTHDILIAECSWVQDVTEEHDMWNSIPWVRIHGSPANAPGVEFDKTLEQRHLDGDFFRGWDIRGDLTIRNCDIRDCFNGIHFFNRIDVSATDARRRNLSVDDARRSTANVLIENNRFTRVRDNVIEPEAHAWNWVVRHNSFLDCYRPFSLELERAGYIYIYANQGAFARPPSLQMSDEEKARIKDPNHWRRTFSLFKCKGTQDNDGPIVVAYNSWVMASVRDENRRPGDNEFLHPKGIFPKGVLGGLMHRCNAVQFIPDTTTSVFGFAGKPKFTREWTRHGITMDADTVNSAGYPGNLIDHYYPIGSAAIGGNPNFDGLDLSITDAADLQLIPMGQDAVDTAIPFSAELPDGTAIRFDSPTNRGAHQSQGGWDGVDASFRFLPEFSWAARSAATV